jgi:hypothetical protein
MFACYAVVCKEKWLKFLLIYNSVECIAYGNKTVDVAHHYNICNAAPHYATMVVLVRHIMLQQL